MTGATSDAGGRPAIRRMACDVRLAGATGVHPAAHGPLMTFPAEATRAGLVATMSVGRHLFHGTILDWLSAPA